MAARDAACHCGQLRLEVEGDPFAVSICNCRACQRRTGSAFGIQAGFKADQVQVVGRFSDYSRVSDEADRKEHVFHFCPRPGPDVWDSVRPLYDAGRYAEAADKGRELIAGHPDEGQLYYHTACCESLAGEPGHAVEHLRRAIALWEGCRELATGDSDFDPIRYEPAFQDLLSG